MDQDHPTAILLAAFVDRELTPSQSAQVAGHLEQCGRCLNYVQVLQNMSVELQCFSLPDGLGEGIQERVLQALPKRQKRGRSSGLLPWLPPALLAATNIGLQAVFVVALAFAALSALGIVDVGDTLTAWLPTELPADVAFVSEVTGDVLGWLAFGSLGPAFRSLMDSAGIDASPIVPWLVPVAITVAVPVVLGTGFLSWLAVAWGIESNKRSRSLRTA